MHKVLFGGILKQWVKELQNEVINLHCITERQSEIDNDLGLQEEIVGPHSNDFQGYQKKSVNSKETTPWRRRSHGLW